MPHTTIKDALRAVREESRSDRKVRLLQARLNQIHEREERITAAAIDWQKKKWRKVCWVLYWVLFVSMGLVAQNIAQAGMYGLYPSFMVFFGFVIAHLIIKNTWGKPAYWVLFGILSLATFGAYIPIHFLYKIGVAER